MSPPAPRCPGKGQREYGTPHAEFFSLSATPLMPETTRLLNHHTKTQRAQNGWEGEMWRRQRQNFATLLQKEQNPESSSLTSRKDTTDNIPREGDSICGAPHTCFHTAPLGGSDPGPPVSPRHCTVTARLVNALLSRSHPTCGYAKPALSCPARDGSCKLLWIQTAIELGHSCSILWIKSQLFQPGRIHLKRETLSVFFLPSQLPSLAL